MTDLPPAGDPGTPDPAAAPAEPAPTGEIVEVTPDPAAPPAQDPAPETDPSVVPDPEGGAVSDAPPEAPESVSANWDDKTRAYIEGLRDEAAGNRVKSRDLEAFAKPFQEVFDGVDDQSKGAVLQLAKTLLDDPAEKGPQELIRVAKALAGSDERFQELMAGAEQPKLLTREELEAELQQREQRQAEEKANQEAVEAVQRESKELGYEDDTVDKSMLFFFAHKQTNGDLQAAHAKVQEFRQGIIDDFVADAKAKGQAFPPVSGAVTPGGGGPAETVEGPKTLEEADRRTRAALAQALS